VSRTGHWYRLGGVSMLPLTAPVDALVARDGTLVAGDIAAFIDRRGRTIFHRVIEVRPDSYITRGDTNPWLDPVVPFDAMLGRVTALRVGPLVLRMPRHGRRARFARRLGLQWGRVAPGLRSVVRPFARTGQTAA